MNEFPINWLFLLILFYQIDAIVYTNNVYLIVKWKLVMIKMCFNNRKLVMMFFPFSGEQGWGRRRETCWRDQTLCFISHCHIKTDSSFWSYNCKFAVMILQITILTWCLVISKAYISEFWFGWCYCMIW